MSKSGRAIRRVRRQHPAQQQRPLKVRGPGEIVTAIPYLLGYEPTESVVAMALDGPRNRLGVSMRVDIVEEPDLIDDFADHMVQSLERHHAKRVVVAVYTTSPGRADDLVWHLIDLLKRCNIDVADAIRTDGSRWWSYTCHGKPCCPAEGTPYEPQTSRVAAEMVIEGMQKAPDRDSLRSLVARAPLSERERFWDLCEAYILSCSHEELLADVVASLDQIVERCLDDPTLLSDDDFVALMVEVLDLTVRDAMWGLIRRDNANAHFELWRHVMSKAPDALFAGPAALAGFAAWIDGDGTLANHVGELLQVVRPEYSMGQLLNAVLASATSPVSWNDVPFARRLGDPPITPPPCA